MLESSKFVPKPHSNFKTFFQNLNVDQSITLLHLGQESKHFAEGYQERILLVTNQMIDLRIELSTNSIHIKHILSDSMDVSKLYIFYFLISKAYIKR